jgi:hypothetical protein
MRGIIVQAADSRSTTLSGAYRRLLGTGEKTWVRWESGKVPHSPAIDKEIRRFLRDPAYVAQLMDEKRLDNPTAREVIADAVARAKRRAITVAAQRHPDQAEDQVASVASAVLEVFGREIARSFEPTTGAADMSATFARYAQSVPVDVEALARDLGIRVYRDPNLGRDISGKIVRETGNGLKPGYAIAVNAREAFVRQRYTIAHELSHFLLHQEKIGYGVTEDALYRGPFSAPQEREANAKAAEILMPADLVRRAHAQTQSISVLASQFRASDDAMRIRLRELGLQGS